MARRDTTQPPSGWDSESTGLAQSKSGVSASGEGRRFLKHLDRRLQRFSSRIDTLEERANRLSADTDNDLILAVESLHRETLLLRAEIREHLAGGPRALEEMTEYAEESWDQLREAFEELKENLGPAKASARHSSRRPTVTDEDDGEPWTSDDTEWLDPGQEWGSTEVHPPRLGPKR